MISCISGFITIQSLAVTEIPEGADEQQEDWEGDDKWPALGNGDDVKGPSTLCFFDCFTIGGMITPS